VNHTACRPSWERYKTISEPVLYSVRGLRGMVVRDRTQEYYWYDPPVPRELQGWRLQGGGNYQAMTPDERGCLWSPSLQRWIGRWEGTYTRAPAVWLRRYDQEGRLVPTSDEAAEQRAEAKQARAEAERIRAPTAEAEVERVRAGLARRRAENS
jgi:hypothetical protein